jgi:glucoamylase
MHATSESGRNVDSATIHASVRNYDPEAGCDPATLQPCSDRALANLKVVVERFKPLYPIASKISARQGSPIGMFFEDMFMGGQVIRVF